MFESTRDAVMPLSMQSLSFTEVSPFALREIVKRHDLRVASFEHLPQIGMINSIYLLGDALVLRVPREHRGTVAQAHIDAIAAPAAYAAGIHTPRLVAYDDRCDLLPVPYMIFERVIGRTLGLLDWEPAEIPRIWHELGRDLALLHLNVPLDGPAGNLAMAETIPDPRLLAENRATDGWLTSLEVRWLTRWLDRLAPATLAPISQRMLHLDVQATNIIVDRHAMEYRAWDFVGIPLRAVPAMLDGHRSVVPLDGDDGAEARILWRHIQLALATLPRGPVPGLAWGERPLAWLLEVFRFFAEPVGVRWQDLRPL
jgi:hypothetical protein